MEEFLKFLKQMYENDKDSTVKVFVNNKPVVDIENGEDMLKDVRTNVTKSCDNCTVKEAPKMTQDPYDKNQITKNIYKDPDEETYYVRESANGQRLSTERPLVFDFKAKDGIITPGFTDADLAFILLYRNRDNTIRYNAIMDFIKSL